MRASNPGEPSIPYHAPLPPPKGLGATVGFLKDVGFDELVARFGPPFVAPPPEESDGRTQVIWTIAWDDGSRSEIYDYKVGPNWLGPVEGIPYRLVRTWDVSGDRKGYRYLLRLFDRKASRTPNASRRRPNLAVELLQAAAPAAIMAVMTALRGQRPTPLAARKPPGNLPGFEQLKDWDQRFGGARVGIVNVPYERMVEVFGKPTKLQERPNGDRWPDVTWFLLYKDGTAAMVYDWQLTVPVEENASWHVAGTDVALDYVAGTLGLEPNGFQDDRVKRLANSLRR